MRRGSTSRVLQTAVADVADEQVEHIAGEGVLIQPAPERGVAALQIADVADPTDTQLYVNVRTGPKQIVRFRAPFHGS